MNANIDFSKLAQWQKSAEQNKALVRVLHESAQELLEGKTTPLSLAFHEASVVAVYQKFGFLIFAPESRRLLANAQSKQTRINSRILLEWLDQAAYQQLADFHVLRYLESEPDWLELNQDFTITLIQRIIVCSQGEWNAVGLEHYPQELAEFLLSVVDQQLLQMRQSGEFSPSLQVLKRALESQHDVCEIIDSSLNIWSRAIDSVLQRVAQDPLRLLAWRLQAFSTERQLSQDSRLAVTNNPSDELEVKALNVVALMIVLAGYDFGRGHAIIAETPVTFSQLKKALTTFFSVSGLQTNVLCELLGYDRFKSDLAEVLERTISLGNQLGVLYWSSLGKSRRGILLTSLAFQILDPYQELIKSTFTESTS